MVIAVNLKGPFLCTQAAARDMAKRKKGTIINISSVHEDLPFPGYAAYCAAKGGLRMLCRDLALELAPHGINVINVAPGAIDTPINQPTLSDPEKKVALEREIPLGRVEQPQEVAKLVCYLASDDASYITGATIVIAGGLMYPERIAVSRRAGGDFEKQKGHETQFRAGPRSRQTGRFCRGSHLTA